MAVNMESSPKLARRHLLVSKLGDNYDVNIKALSTPGKIYPQISPRASDGSESDEEIETDLRYIKKTHLFSSTENLVFKDDGICKVRTNDKSFSSSFSPRVTRSMARAGAQKSVTVDAPRSNSCNWKLVVCSLIVLALAGTAYYVSSENVEIQNDEATENAIKVFESELNSLQLKFPNFNKKMWKTILAVVRTTLSKKPVKTPGIIAIMAPSNRKKLANCFGKKLANLVQTAFNDSDYVNLKGEAFTGEEASKVKLKMDSEIREGFETRNQHVVLFENLHAIPPASSILFHGLCDNVNAPFKQVIYIFTVENNNAENLKDETITTVWTDQLDIDTLSSLESRIGNNVVVINREASNDVENKMCN